MGSSSALTRLNQLTTVAMYAMSAVALSAFMTTHFLEKTTDVQLKIHKTQVKKLQEFQDSRKKNDAGFLTFDVEFDSRPLWNWNTKQLYLYLVVSYQTENNDINDVTIWDKIIHRHQYQHKISQKVSFKKYKNKYYFFDDGNGLVDNKNMTLQLYWNAVPNVGHFWLVQGKGSQKFEFDAEYSTSRF